MRLDKRNFVIAVLATLTLTSQIKVFWLESQIHAGDSGLMNNQMARSSNVKKENTPYDVWAHEHCWRDRVLLNRSKYQLLVTGAGYSATGFFSAAFTKAGYPVGHEKDLGHGMVGLSDWMMASRYSNPNTPFLFKHVFLLVRHPLKVVRSRDGSGWTTFAFSDGFNVKSDVAQHETLTTNSTAFQDLQIEFKTLEWWVVYTMLGENIAECFVRAEDISSDLLLYMCIRSELKGCHEKSWAQIQDESSGYNSHTKKLSDRQKNLKTWDELEEMAKTDDERSILKHAREICKKYYNQDEC